MTSDNPPAKDLDSESPKDEFRLMSSESLRSKKLSCERVLRMNCLPMPDNGDGARRVLHGIEMEMRRRREEKSKCQPRRPPPPVPPMPSFLRRDQAKTEKQREDEGLFFASCDEDEAKNDDGREINLPPKNPKKKLRLLHPILPERRVNDGGGSQPSKLGGQLCLQPSQPESFRNTSPKRRRVDEQPQSSRPGGPLDNHGSWSNSNGDFQSRQQVRRGKNCWKNTESIFRIQHIESKEDCHKKPEPQHPHWRPRQREGNSQVKHPKQKPIPTQRKRRWHNSLPGEKPPELQRETIVLEGDSDSEPASEKDQIVDPPDTGQKIKITMDSDLEHALEGVGNVAYPKDGGKGMVMVSPRDLQRLDPTEFLNDNCIDLYIKVIETTCPQESRCHFFRSFFFGRLVQSDGYRGDNCRRPTKDVDLFKKDYVFVPVHQDIHWSLAIICFPGNIHQSSDRGKQPCILHLDSMGEGGHDTDGVCKVLRGYLAGEWSRKRGGVVPDITEEAIPHKLVKHIPQQVNSWDCGLFLLTYMEFFSYVAPGSLNCHNLQECKKLDFPNFLRKGWFSAENAGLLRTKLRVLVYERFIEELADKNKEAVEMLENQRSVLLQTKIKYQGPEEILLEAHFAGAITPVQQRNEALEGSSSIQLVREMDGSLMT